jgi:hypothetical protein
MPPGYGAPPGAPPGAYPPQGFAGQYVPGTAQPPKSNRTMLYAGLGCGFLLLVVLGGAVAAFFWVKARSNAAIEDLQRLQASASANLEAPQPPSLTGGGIEPSRALSGDCAIAYGCCRAIAGKSDSAAAAVQACEVLKIAGYPQASCTAALANYRKAAEVLGLKCQ